MTDVLQLLPTIFLILIAVLVVITIGYVYRNYSIMKRLLAAQSLKRGGTVQRTYMVHQFKFQHHDYPVTVSAHQGSRYQPPETKVHVDLHKPVPSVVSISHESLASRIGKAFGGQDIQIGMDEFDNAYRVKGENENYVRTIVDLTVQNKLLEFQHQRPRILLKGQTLDVDVQRLLKTTEQYDQLIDLTTTLIDHLPESQ